MFLDWHPPPGGKLPKTLAPLDFCSLIPRTCQCEELWQRVPMCAPIQAKEHAGYL